MHNLKNFIIDNIVYQLNQELVVKRLEGSYGNSAPAFKLC